MKIEETQEKLFQKSLEELDNISDLIMPIRVKNMAKESIPNVNYIAIRKDLIHCCLNIKSRFIECKTINLSPFHSLKIVQ